MPIRFRCRYCHQLMGISRRKAGTAVRCPSCNAQVVVPETAAAEPASPAAAQPAAPPAVAPIFERSDFEAMLRDPVNEAPPRAENPPAVKPEPAPPPLAESLIFSAPSSPVLPTRPVGLLLSPTQATWLTVAAILLLALAFGAGLLIGHYWMG